MRSLLTRMPQYSSTHCADFSREATAWSAFSRPLDKSEHSSVSGSGSDFGSFASTVSLIPEASAFFVKEEQSRLRSSFSQKCFGGDGIHVTLNLLNVRLGLLRLIGGKKATDSRHMVAHIMLIDRHLHLHISKALHFHLRLLQPGHQHGALQLGIRLGLHLLEVGSEKNHIEDDECRGKKLIHRLDSHRQCVGVYHSGVVKEVVGHRQTAKKQKRRRGNRHGTVGRTYKIPVQKQKKRVELQSYSRFPLPEGNG